MSDQLIPFGPGAQTFIALYLLSLIGIGALGYRARRDESMRDFYLAGRGIGFIVLLLTLYSTQYSGNTLFGFTGKTYRIGFSWAMCIHFMTAIVVVYLFFAPQLHAAARRKGYITPSDFLSDRFASPALSVVASIVMVIAISNYLLAQLMAMGRALEGLTAADPVRAYTLGVIVLALIIVVYETLGGFRAVAWTDVIQGSVLLVGFFILLAMVLTRIGSLSEATEILAQREPQKTMPPDADRSREWISYVVLVGLGGALYPQSIQRIYAARSATTLRRSLMVMAFLPLTTTLIAVIVGVIGSAYYPGLPDARSDTILTVLCRQIQQQSMFGYWLVAVLFAAVLAAIMSTADSVLLSISSMLTKDVYGRLIVPDASQKHLTRFGKVCSWVLMVLLTWAAIRLRGTTLITLLDRKFDLLIQLSPGFILGIHWKRMKAGPTLLGLLAGVATSIAMAGLGHGKLYGVHAGIYGLAVNLAFACGGSMFVSKRGGLDYD